MLLKGIILNCCSKINGSRTIQSIFHALTGKKSIQTIQDVHLFNIEKIYGIYKSLTIEDFNNYVNMLHEQNFIYQLKDNIYMISEVGEKWLKQHETIYLLGNLNGLKYHSIDSIFFQRLLLFVQVISNYQMNNSSYIPIIDHPQIMKWVKRTFKKIKPNFPDQANLFYNELHLLLSKLKERDADLFVNRLTGYKHYGMSIQQLSKKYEISIFDIHVLFAQILHQMLETITVQSKQFLFMNSFLTDLMKNDSMTNSAQLTYQLIKKGHSIDEIAKIRNLKVNTIFDHIVEITLYDKSFSIHMYVTEEEQLEILNAVKKAKSTKLKTIKELLHNDISYFKIRLTLAVATTRIGDVFD